MPVVQIYLEDLAKPKCTRLHICTLIPDEPILAFIEPRFAMRVDFHPVETGIFSCSH